MSAPAGLSIAELFADPPCDWFIFSKVKSGPGVFWACKTCHRTSKTKLCPGAQSNPSPAGGQDHE